MITMLNTISLVLPKKNKYSKEKALTDLENGETK